MDKTSTCPCGNIITIPNVTPEMVEFHGCKASDYDVCGIECPECHRHTTGGYIKTGEITSWITAHDSVVSEQIYQNQLIDIERRKWGDY